MQNKAKHYAGQPCMIGIWESMWRKIANRLDDEKEYALENGTPWTWDKETQLNKADRQWDILVGMLDEAEQLQNNVARLTDPIKWRFDPVGSLKDDETA